MSADTQALAPLGLQFHVLGPLRVTDGDAEIPLGGTKQRTVLAVLAARPRSTVSVTAIATAVWDDDVPPKHAATIQVYISALRKALSTGPSGKAVIDTSPPGYRLAISDEQLDLTRFRRGRATGIDAARAGRWDHAVIAFGAALEEWRGVALADLRGLPFADDLATALEEERLATLQARIEADIRLGKTADVVSELTTLTREHPLREPFWGQLITALHSCGRQADALDAYRRLRTVLQDELGLDPSPALRQLESDVLAQRLPNLAAASHPDTDERTWQDDLGDAHRALLTDDLGRQIDVGGSGLRFGRLAGNDVVIDDKRVSRHHAVITHTASGFIVTDLNSTNGTMIAGHRLAHPALLSDGDEIVIGPRRYQFQLLP